jgi:hypothetical protein
MLITASAGFARDASPSTITAVSSVGFREMIPELANTVSKGMVDLRRVNVAPGPFRRGLYAVPVSSSFFSGPRHPWCL